MEVIAGVYCVFKVFHDPDEVEHLRQGYSYSSEHHGEGFVQVSLLHIFMLCFISFTAFLPRKCLTCPS